MYNYVRVCKYRINLSREHVRQVGRWPQAAGNRCGASDWRHVRHLGTSAASGIRFIAEILRYSLGYSYVTYGCNLWPMLLIALLVRAPLHAVPGT